MFSSPVRIVPHGVTPPAQLFRVPRIRVPPGSALVRMSACPAAGPRTVIGVMPVIRRFSAESRTTLHSPWGPRAISTTVKPCAATSTSHISRVRSALPSQAAHISSGRAFSWFTPRSPRVAPSPPAGSGTKPMKSLSYPNWRS